MPEMDSPQAEASLRLDKWLWFARFVKSRSLASKLVEQGRMRVIGTPTAKAHYAVRMGDVLTFALGPHIRVIKIVALGMRRGPAPEAQQLYLDLDPPAPRADSLLTPGPTTSAGLSFCRTYTRRSPCAA